MVSRRLSAPILGLVAGASLLGGCAGGEGDYPSLLPRPIEQTAAVPPIEEAAPAAAADPAIDARVAALTADLDKGERAFAEAEGTARSAVSRSGAVGSEGWLSAQQAISALESARNDVGSALAELDAMRLEASQRSALVDTTRLDAAWVRADALATKQRETISSLSAALPQ